MLKFDPDLHQYSIGSEILPSITQILAAEGFIDSTWYTAAGRDRGTTAHKITHDYDMGELFEELLDPAYIPYLKAYKQFLQDTGFKVLASEVPRYHMALRYAGTPDKVGEMRGCFAVVEQKSGALEPWTRIQAAAQGELVKQDFNVARVKRYGLQLRPDGKYRLIEYDNRQDEGIWLSTLAIHHWKHNNLKGILK